LGAWVAHSLKHLTSSNIQKYFFVVSFKAMSHPLPCIAVRVGGGGPICCQWVFPLPENYSVTFIVVNISILVLILFISWICFGHFVEVLFVFNFILQSQLSKYYFFQFGTHSFNYYFFAIIKLIFIFNFTIQSKIKFICISILIPVLLVVNFCFGTFCIIDILFPS